MSRSGSLQQVLGDTEVRVKAIKPSGDCFYEAIAVAFTMMSEDVRDCSEIVAEEADSGAMALRRTAAMSVDREVLDTFNMYHQAGLADFHFMRRIRTEADLRQRLLVTGGGYNIQLSFSIGTGPEWKNGYSGLVPNGKKAIRDWCLSPIFLY